MTFRDIASVMWINWLFGLFVILSVYYSKHRNMIRIEIEPIIFWCKMLAIITVGRVIAFKYFDMNHDGSAVADIPTFATLTVYWEDTISLILVLFLNMVGDDKIWKKAINFAAIVLTMIYFGSGHMYQGIASAVMLSFYIPFSIKKAPKIGWGTLMVCHTLYDLTTILTVKNFVG